MKTLLFYLGRIWGCLFPYSLQRRWKVSIGRRLYTGRMAGTFRCFGQGSTLMPKVSSILGGQYISIGHDTHIGPGAVIHANDAFGPERFQPEIRIGDRCFLGDHINLTAIDRIEIGNGVRMGKHVFISDNYHGSRNREELAIAPNLRPMQSKGPVIIEDNVFIGEKASVLSGVRIGTGSTVAAHAVVTRDVPPFSLVAGVPAKVIETR